jgi:hypothetical protein
MKSDFIELYEELSKAALLTETLDIAAFSKYLKTQGFSGDSATDFATRQSTKNLKLGIKFASTEADETLFKLNDSIAFSLQDFKTTADFSNGPLINLATKADLRQFISNFQDWSRRIKKIPTNALKAFIFLFAVVTVGKDKFELIPAFLNDEESQQAYFNKQYKYLINFLNSKCKDKGKPFTITFKNITFEPATNLFPLKVTLFLNYEHTDTKIDTEFSSTFVINNFEELQYIIFSTKKEETDITTFFTEKLDIDSLAIGPTEDKSSDEADSDDTEVEPRIDTDDTSKVDETETSKAESKADKLKRIKANNKKIIDGFRAAGVPVDDLIITATDKNGKKYTKASDKLNRLRKTLFGE